MKTFREFIIICEAVYDKEVMYGSQIKTTMTTGGRISAERKKSTPEIRRTKRIGGGQSKPTEYKARTDIGKQRSASERQDQPEQERGSADVKARAAAAAKEERKKAALARRDGEQTPKPKAKDLESAASKLLSKKAATKSSKPASDDRFSSSRNPEDHQIRGKYSKEEKKKIVRAGKRLHRDISKGVDKPASQYQP
tara:strand:- start:1576 stop:2163 length:588 start_codon:yes stop_codon:yes gene_type:complete